MNKHVDHADTNIQWGESFFFLLNLKHILFVCLAEQDSMEFIEYFSHEANAAWCL